MPVLSTSDRRAFLRATWSPFLPEAEWAAAATRPEGRAQVYLGIPGGIGAGAAWTKDGNVAEAYFGGLVAGAGDVNADGYDDLLVRQNSDGSGVAGVLLYMGSGSGPGAFYAWSTTATEGLVNYPSHSMAPAGDTASRVRGGA